MGPFVTLTAADGFSFPAYVAQPDGPARGGLVLLQEIFGVNAHIRAVADAYAADGYRVVAPSTFHRVRAGVELTYTPPDIAAGMELKAAVEALPAPGVQHDIQAAVRDAAQAGRVAVMGYCWGGLLSWRAASLLDGLSAAVCYYGGGMTTPAEIARQPRVPVLAHFAETDRWIALDGVQALRQAHPELAVHLYPAHHGFNCDHREAWNAEAARLARERTLAFLAQQLG